MAYNPDLFTTQGLVTWLETRNPHEGYDYERPMDCVIARYLQANGHPEAAAGVSTISLQPKVDYYMPRGWNKLADQQPRTFGGALARAKELLKQQP